MSCARSLQVLLLWLVALAPCAATAAPRLSVEPSVLTAGEPVVVEMTVTAPEAGIAAGGRLRFPFYMKPWNGLLGGLSQDRISNALVSAERSDGGAALTRNVSRNPEFAILSDLEVEVADTPLPAGATLRVRFGVDRQKVRTTRKQRRLVVEAELDADGDGTFQKLPPPDLQVRAAAPESLHVVGPSFPDEEGPETFVVWAEDRFANVCEDYEARLAVEWTPPYPAGRTVWDMHPWDETLDLDRNEFELDSPVSLTLRDPELGLSTTWNVKSGKAPGEADLYWGEIHVHSQISDGKGELADIYRGAYAKGLDFLAITDHGFGRDARGPLKERLVDLCEHAERFNRPGRFVTIPAGETHYLPKTHMNIYFSEPDAGRIHALHNELRTARPKASEVATAEQRRAGVRPYWEVLGSPEFADFALAFPHHTMWIGYPEFINADLQRVIEVYSTHGSSETRDPTEVPEGLRMKKWRQEAGTPDSKYSVREALAAGHNLAFVGGSDDHSGQPGSKALTAVWARELTRDAILGAIRRRHCYATTGNRTLVSGFDLSGRMCFVVAPASPIERVECFAGGEHVDIEPEIADPWSAVLYLKEPRPPLHETTWYVRVVLSDGGMVWSTLATPQGDIAER